MQNVDMGFEKGRHYAIVGENGAVKSTLMPGNWPPGMESPVKNGLAKNIDREVLVEITHKAW